VDRDLETLIVRSRVAALHTKQLQQALLASQARVKELIVARRTLRFVSADRKIIYPQDIPTEKRTWFRPASDDHA
jgi:hypothetical protein